MNVETLGMYFDLSYLKRKWMKMLRYIYLFTQRKGKGIKGQNVGSLLGLVIGIDREIRPIFKMNKFIHTNMSNQTHR